MSSNVICCPVIGGLAPECNNAIQKYAPECKWHWIRPGDKFAYSDIVRSYWFGGENLIVIEQDIEIESHMIASFESCPNPWCVYAYDLFDGYTTTGSLGCAKFSPECQSRTNLCAQEWQYFDMAINRHLRFLGFRPHVHGLVKHHHDYSHLTPEELAYDLDQMSRLQDKWDRESSRPCNCLSND